MDTLQFLAAGAGAGEQAGQLLGLGTVAGLVWGVVRFVRGRREMSGLATILLAVLAGMALCVLGWYSGLGALAGIPVPRDVWVAAAQGTFCGLVAVGYQEAGKQAKQAAQGAALQQELDDAAFRGPGEE